MKLPLSAYWRLLRRYVIPQRATVLWMAVLLLVSIGTDIAGPQIIRRFVDAAVAGSGLRVLTQTGLALLAIQLVGDATDALANYWSQRVAWRATNGLRADLTAHVLRLDLDFFQAHPPGALIERIDGDVSTLGAFFSTFAIGLLGALLLLAGILSTLLLEDVRLALILVACSGLAVGVLAWARRYGTPHIQANRACQAGFFGYLGEVLGATEDLRAAGAEGYARRRLLGRLRAWLPVAVRTHVMSSSLFWISGGVGIVIYTLTRGLGARLVLDGRMTLGTLFMLFTYLDRLLWGPLASISNQLQTLQRAEASIARVRELLQASSRLRDGTTHLPSGAPAIEFRNVRFAYPTQPGVGAPTRGARQANDTQGHAQGLPLHRNQGPTRSYALEDISFHLHAGRTLGLLGRTGSGKTTIGRLLYRFYDPQQGQILMGGVDLRQTTLASLRARVGLVTQDVQLLAGTLRDNLCLYERMPDRRLVDALARLGLERWLERFPEGLDTPLTGVSLSAGEAQLVALARVTLQDPGLVILDEATSRLDPATEVLLSQALDRLLQGRTALIIAHRLSTLAHVDEILILEEGRAVEWGAYAKLARDPGSRLSQLLRTGLREVQP